MPRTGREMIRNCRELLHDTGRGFATANTMFVDAEIALGLNEAKRRIAKALLARPKAGPNGAQPGAPEGPAFVTLSRLAKTCAATSGTPVPADFWYLQAGIQSDNTYVPRVPLPIGEALVGAGHDLVYVRGGTFFGTAATALYWAYPTEVIADSTRALTEFPDGFYDAVELLAARELLIEEQSDAADRWKFFTDFFMESIQSFQ